MWFHSQMKLDVLFLSMHLMLFDLALSQWKCNSRIFGRPVLEDCASTFLALPDAKETVRTEKLSLVRKFVEPQFLEPPFSPVQNDLATEMEQVPKFWRYSKLTYGHYGQVDNLDILISG